MFLHIGEDYIVSLNEIVAIFDIENTTIMRDSREFLKDAEDNGVVISVSGDIPKSFIITSSVQGMRVYLSPLSCYTLRKRAASLINIFQSK